VPTTPPDDAGPVGYGATGVGTTVAVDLTSLTVRYCVTVLLIVVVDTLDSSAPADCWYPAPGIAGAAGVYVASAVGEDVASATGQTVVYKLITSVVTWPSLAGQLVTVGAQEVIV
jgi:hypothetical protein